MSIEMMIGVPLGGIIGLWLIIKSVDHQKTNYYYKAIVPPMICTIITTIIIAIVPSGEPMTIERLIWIPAFILTLYCFLWWIRTFIGFNIKYIKFPTKSLKEYSNESNNN